MLSVKFTLDEGAILPTRGSVNSAGLDFYANESTIIFKRGRASVSTGVRAQLHPNTWACVKPRSGLAFRNGLDVGAGVIDCDYRGEWKVLLFNHTDTDYTIIKGDRIAQFIILPYLNIIPVLAKTLEDSERGNSGFGSTGK